MRTCAADGFLKALPINDLRIEAFIGTKGHIKIISKMPSDKEAIRVKRRN